MNEKEIWKDVPNYENYYKISNRGNLVSLDRVVIYKRGGKRLFKGQKINASMCNGYRTTSLSKNGVQRTFKIAQIVAMAFLNHKPDGYSLIIDHINGVRDDDRVENLQIVTCRENSSTCFRSNDGSFTSEHIGVYWYKATSKWMAQLRHDRKRINLGYFENEIDASNAYQKALAKIEDGVFDPDDYKPKWSSKYKGVSFDKNKNKWVSYIDTKSIREYLGQFQTEIEAYNAIVDYKLNNKDE